MIVIPIAARNNIGFLPVLSANFPHNGETIAWLKKVLEKAKPAYKVSSHLGKLPKVLTNNGRNGKLILEPAPVAKLPSHKAYIFFCHCANFFFRNILLRLSFYSFPCSLKIFMEILGSRFDHVQVLLIQ